MYKRKLINKKLRIKVLEGGYQGSGRSLKIKYILYKICIFYLFSKMIKYIL